MSMRVSQVKGSVNGGGGEAPSPPKQESPAADDSAAPARARAMGFIRTLTVWDFIDPDHPLVLVEDGSLAGLFDFIPVRFRVRGRMGARNRICYSPPI
jgi:hypothetical protein